MAFQCRVPVKPAPRTAEEPADFVGQGPQDNPFDGGVGTNVVGDFAVEATCQGAFNVSWNSWLTDPEVTPEPETFAALATQSFTVGENVAVQVLSVSAVFQARFGGVIPPSKWNQVESIELLIPWAGISDLFPWRLILDFMGDRQELFPPEEQYFVPVPLANPDIVNIFIFPGLNTPPAPCPEEQLLLLISDGIVEITLNLFDRLDPGGNDSNAPLDAPFEVDMIGLEGARNVISPPLSVQAGP